MNDEFTILIEEGEDLKKEDFPRAERDASLIHWHGLIIEIPIFIVYSRNFSRSNKVKLL